MIPLDLFMIHFYMLAIFATLVKTKIDIKLYRTLKLAVVLLFVSWLYLHFKSPPTKHWVYFLLQLLPMVLVFIVMVKTEVNTGIRFLGIKAGFLVATPLDASLKAELLQAITRLSDEKIGALITFERSDRLDEFIDAAFPLDASIQQELLVTLFMPKTPLHDGAVIIRESRLVCAGAYYPTSDQVTIPKSLGSRHRAAIGISEITDALTIIVSEQTGHISITINGYLDQDISHDSLMLYVEKYL